jgi:hypothetical protein
MTNSEAGDWKIEIRNLKIREKLEICFFFDFHFAISIFYFLVPSLFVIEN